VNRCAAATRPASLHTRSSAAASSSRSPSAPTGDARAVAVLEGIDPAVDECLLNLVASAAFAPTTTGDLVLVRWRTVFEPAE
jgi:hypothetical protein